MISKKFIVPKRKKKNQALLISLLKNGQKYPSMVKSLINNENLFIFFDYP